MSVLYCQSPALFWCALALIVCFFVRRGAHRVRAVLDLVLGLLCIVGGVALYYLGMYNDAFTIRDFWQIRTAGWIGLAAVVLLTYTKYDSPAAYTQAMNLGLVVLPFVLLTSVMLLRAVLVLSDHEKLEQSSQLASVREVYYQGLQQQECQVRTLRHDLRNHLTVVRGRLEQGDTAGCPLLSGRTLRLPGPERHPADL